MTDPVLFEAGKSYTAEQIAQRLGITGDRENLIRWTRENIFAAGCKHRQIGRVRVATGQELNRWIAEGAEAVAATN